MVSRRQRQVGELLHQEISRLIQHGVRDPRLGFITVTGVDVSPDLRQAKVYVSVFGDDEETESSMEGLTSASGYFRRELGQTLSLRYVPELTFKLDESLDYGLHIDQLLDTIQEQRETNAQAEESDSAAPPVEEQE